MSGRDLDSPAAITAWDRGAVQCLTGPDSAVFDSHPDRVTATEQAARLAFVQEATASVLRLVKGSRSPDDAIIYASGHFAELLGRAIGTGHTSPCRTCLQENLRPLIQSYTDGFMLQLNDQVAPARMDA